MLARWKTYATAGAKKHLYFHLFQSRDLAFKKSGEIEQALHCGSEHEWVLSDWNEEVDPIRENWV